VRIGTIRPVYVDSFPKALEDGVLYISRKFSTACHRCCCGCGTKIVTPIRRTEYSLTDIGGRVSLYPSIGNWNHPCQTHYVIRNGEVIAAGAMRQREISAGRASDEAEKQIYFSNPAQSWFTAILRWIRGQFL
jgi:Family of unknown function (DUF6527)